MNLLKKILLSSCICIGLISLVGCRNGYFRTTVNGKDTKNSTKVSKVEFIKEYKDSFKDEVITNKYSNTKGLFGRVYFKNVPDGDPTNIKFIWKINENVADTVHFSIDEKNSKSPTKCYLSGNDTFPDGNYTLEIYLEDTNELLNTTNIDVQN
ncbi:hypothetical protein SAMN02745163_03883 [Clostridium cavendishii DSM 21758]|uniref:Lipoprotein n=1 Tax=Clostridium cavendishii DSM 21758 TaxID=1121302 RepID=A0A1M6SUG5_9CLOT|nr:hypothetical protein [Clostridium cavendishii]SHK48364.1 hypothetical protein SAMN02745163_03883 [Clostridium cavendishii DSM 21758]